MNVSGDTYRPPADTTEAYNFGLVSGATGHPQRTPEEIKAGQSYPDSVWRAYFKGYQKGRERWKARRAVRRVQERMR